MGRAVKAIIWGGERGMDEGRRKKRWDYIVTELFPPSLDSLADVGLCG